MIQVHHIHNVYACSYADLKLLYNYIHMYVHTWAHNILIKWA